MTYTWRTNPDGSIEVDETIPTLGGGNAKAFDAKVWRWRELAARWGVANNVPIHWVLGMIYAESLGNPDAKSHDGGFGLMQLTSASARENKTYEQLRDPNENIRLGVKYIARACLSPLAKDLPAVASRYNAGGRVDGAAHPSTVSPWGMRETKGHITRVVSGANYALTRLRQFEGAGLDNMSLVLLSISVIRWLT